MLLEITAYKIPKIFADKLFFFDFHQFGINILTQELRIMRRRFSVMESLSYGVSVALMNVSVGFYASGIQNNSVILFLFQT